MCSNKSDQLFLQFIAGSLAVDLHQQDSQPTIGQPSNSPMQGSSTERSLRPPISSGQAQNQSTSSGQSENPPTSSGQPQSAVTSEGSNDSNGSLPADEQEDRLDVQPSIASATKDSNSFPPCSVEFMTTHRPDENS